MSTGSRPVSRFEALRHHPRWSNEDRATAEAEIDRLHPSEFRLQNSGGAVSLIRDGKAIAWLNAGRISYLDRTVAPSDALPDEGSQGGDYRYRPLSRFVANSGRTTPKEAPVSICPKCTYQLLPGGACGNDRCDAS